MIASAWQAVRITVPADPKNQKLDFLTPFYYYIPMIKIIREILVLPLKLLLLISKFFPIVDQYALVKWIWNIGRVTEDGYKLVSMTVQKEGVQAGRDIARNILVETKSALVAYAIAWYEISGQNFQEAKDWVDFAEEVGCQDLHHTLIIKLRCTGHLDDYDFHSVVDEMLSCKCLSMEHTREALLAKAYILINNGEYDQADKISERLLAVKEDNAARYLKGVACLGFGEDDTAQKHFARFTGNMDENLYFANISSGYFNAGRYQEGMEWLNKAINAGLDVTEENGLLWEVYNSKEFAEYCAARN